MKKMPKVIILSNKRCGSTFLQYALNSHNNILFLDEMFIYSGKAKKRNNIPLFKTKHSIAGLNKIQYLHFLSTLDKQKKVGFRLIYNQEKKYNLLKDIKQYNIKILHLYRKNHAKRVFSKWTAGEQNPKPRYVDPKKLFSESIFSNQQFKNYRQQLKKYKNVLEIEMYSMFGKIEKTQEEEIITKKGAFNLLSTNKTYLNNELNNKICSFLNISDCSMYSKIAKKNKESMNYYIKNYDEVFKYFKDNGKEKWLE